ncbi:MAG: pentapeptide repeat-containing protein [Bacteroidetes bacterium]|nr:pentapeptide repeat-containing protein [Bacteroidota bacterium]
MALAGRPQKSKYQVGDIVYFLNNAKGISSSVIKIQSAVTDPFNDNAGVQENLYNLEGFSKLFSEQELFDSMNALIYNIKGDYLNKFQGLVVVSGDYEIVNSNFSFLDLSNSVFESLNLENCNFENSNLSNVKFDWSNLSNSSFKNAILFQVSFTDASILNANFIGTKLTGATMPANFESKQDFKAAIGEDNWDPVTTIWIDGLPIGN